MVTKILSHPSLGLSFNIYGKLDSPRNHQNLFRLDSQQTIESLDVKRSMMGHNQEVSISIVKGCLFHRLIGRIRINSGSLLQRRLARSHERCQPLNKIHRFSFFNGRYRIPSQGIRSIIDIFLEEVARNDLIVVAGLLILTLDD